MNKLKRVPARSKLSILHQICNYIPQHLVSKIARETGAEDKARTFKPWSHVVSLAYAQLTHSIGLNDLCDSLQLHSGPLVGIRGATAPSRNGLSNANRERPAAMAEQLFWAGAEPLGRTNAGICGGAKPRTGLSLQVAHSCGGHHGDGIGGQLHGLGQTSPAQGGGQNPPAPEPAESAAQLCASSTRRANTTTNGRGNCAPESKAAKSSCLTRVTWTSAICGIWMNAASSGSLAPKTTWLMTSSSRCPNPRMIKFCAR